MSVLFNSDDYTPSPPKKTQKKKKKKKKKKSAFSIGKGKDRYFFARCSGTRTLLVIRVYVELCVSVEMCIEALDLLKVELHAGSCEAPKVGAGY